MLECDDSRKPWKKYAARLCSIELESASGRWEALQGSYEAVARHDVLVEEDEPVARRDPHQAWHRD